MQKLGVEINEKNFYGYNNNVPDQDIPPGFFKQATNVLMTDNKITKVPGSQTIADSIDTNPFVGLSSFENYTNENKYILAAINGASNASWYSWAGSGNFSQISGSDIFTNNAPISFTTANNSLIGINGSEQGDWDGTTFTSNRADFPIGKHMKWFHNYLFVANSSSFPSRLYWSDLGDPLTFDTDNYVDINPGDGDEITGLGTLPDQLLVFKKNTIWSITGFSGASFSATTIAAQNTNSKITGYGCVAPYSIVSTGNDIYFMSFLGDVPHIRSLRLTQYAETLSGGIITYNISGTMNDINKTAIDTTKGIYDGRYIYWSIPTGANSKPDRAIILDTYNIKRVNNRRIYPFTLRTGISPAFMTLSTISGKPNIYFTGNDSAGLVFRINKSIFSDNGHNIPMIIETRGYMPDPARKIKWKYLYLKYDLGNAARLFVYQQIDNGGYALQRTIYLNEDSATLGSFILDTHTLGGGDRSHARVNLKKQTGKIAQFYLFEDSALQQTFYDFQIYGKARGLRQDYSVFQDI